jgi:hypothetical protein
MPAAADNAAARWPDVAERVAGSGADAGSQDAAGRALQIAAVRRAITANGSLWSCQ